MATYVCHPDLSIGPGEFYRLNLREVFAIADALNPAEAMVEPSAWLAGL